MENTPKDLKRPAQGEDAKQEHIHSCQGNCEATHEHAHGEACMCEEAMTIDLVLDDGREMKCQVVGLFDVEEVEYIALLPEEDDKVLLYRYEEEGEEINLENIEEEDEFEKVSEAFWEIFADEMEALEEP